MATATTTAVVLLRGINVGAGRRVPMGEVCALLSGLGASDVVTYRQSGQAVVTVPDGDLAALPGRIEQAMHDRFGLDVRVLVRTAAELERVVAANPYPDRVATPKQLHVVFLAEQPDPAAVAALGTRHDNDELTVGDRVIYVSYSGTSIDSPLVGVLKRLGGVQSARNWATVTALVGLTRCR